MRKLVTIAAISAVGLIAPATASASSDTCARVSQNGETVRCTAITAEDHVSLASIRLGADTRGVYVLTCEQGSATTVQKGRIGRGGARLVAPELSNPDCQLRARGVSNSRAVVRVALT